MSSPNLKSHDEKLIFEAMEKWARKFSASSPESILKLYAEDASLWGTLSPIRRANPASIRDYFEQVFVFTDRLVVFHDSNIRCFGEIAINSGSYTFTLVKEGEKLTIPARYSFTYVKRNGQWLIAEHHSSAMPSE